jgi:hypothetical protein
MVEGRAHRFTRPRLDRIPLYGSLLLLGLGATVLWEFTPGLVVTIGPFWSWIIFSLLALSGSLGILGAFAWFRWETRVFASANRIFHQSAWEPIPVNIQAYALDPETILNDPVKVDRTDLDAVLAVTPGTNEGGYRVSVSVVPLGGYDAGGFSIHPGGLGFLILYGDQQVAQLGDLQRGAYWFTGRPMLLLEHSAIPDDVEEVLLEHPKFVPNYSPVFVLGDLADPYVQSVINSSEILQVAMHAVGVPRIAELITKYMNVRLAREADRALFADPKTRNDFMKGLSFFLSNNVGFQRIVGENQVRSGGMTAAAWRSLYYSASKEINILKNALDDLQSSVQAGHHTIRALMGRTAKIAGAGPSPFGASNEVVARRPNQPDEG